MFIKANDGHLAETQYREAIDSCPKHSGPRQEELVVLKRQKMIAEKNSFEEVSQYAKTEDAYVSILTKKAQKSIWQASGKHRKTKKFKSKQISDSGC